MSSYSPGHRGSPRGSPRAPRPWAPLPANPTQGPGLSFPGSSAPPHRHHPATPRSFVSFLAFFLDCTCPDLLELLGPLARIGFAVARRLAQDGAHVVLSSRNQRNVDRAVAELRAENLSVSGTLCHVGRAEDRERLVATALECHGGIDIFFSNAAVNPFLGNTCDATEDVWKKILQVNVTATALLVGLVVPHMEKRGGGSIVIVSSIAGLAPFPGLGPYSVSKTALLGLTKALAPELGDHNIRINCLAPGLIRTQFSSLLWKEEGVRKKTMENLRVQRMGEPSECAGIVSFLCSPDASYITGETVVVAGGAPSRL